MKVGEIYLQIKQGLVQLGKYADGSIINSELALALDVELMKTVAEVLKASVTETTTFFTVLLNDLKKELPLDTISSNESLKALLPIDCEVPLKVSVKLESVQPYENPTLIIGNLYKPIEQAQINDTWYKSTDVVKATKSEYYGKVNSVSYTTAPTRITSSEKIDIFRTSSFYKSTNRSPLSVIINRDIEVFTPCEGNIILAYYKKPIKFKELSLEDESPYSELVNTELIKQTILNIKQR